MTDRRKHRNGQAGALPVVTGALGSFLVLLAILALQMRSGGDPVLKPTVAASPPQPILKRRIIKTRIIILDAPKANAPQSQPRHSGAPAVARPTVTVSAPAPVQPAPVVPAPVTRTS